MSQQTFNTTELAGDRILVHGNDLNGTAHQVILDAAEYNALRREQALKQAAGTFDAKVEEFFAPLTEAAEEVEAAKKFTPDPAFYIVEQEHEVGAPHQHEVLRSLTKDTAVLRLIEQGNTARLLWVGDTIEVLAQSTPAPEVEAVDLTKVFDGVAGSGDTASFTD